MADLGHCPICLGEARVRNIGREHWGYCEAHRKKWLIGENLFSAWREEAPAIHLENKLFLSSFEEVA